MEYTRIIIGIYMALIGFAVVFLIATAAIAKVVFITIQPGQIFGGWQHVLNKLNDAHSRLANALYKPLGGCEVCFSHMLALISYFVFFCFTYMVFDSWPLNVSHNIWINIGSNIVGYLMYVCMSTVLSTLAITRL